MGRKLRCRSPSVERTDTAPIRSRRAAQREARKARKVAAAGDANEEEAQWRVTLRDAAEQGDEAGGRHPSAESLDGEPLLPNWFRAEDAASGGVYYHNAATREVCWEVPLAARRPMLSMGLDLELEQPAEQPTEQSAAVEQAEGAPEVEGATTADTTVADADA